MSVLNTVKGKMRELGEAANSKAGDIAGSEKVSSAKSALANGLAGAGKFVDEKTGGKYASQINSGVDKAKGLLGQHDKADERAKQPGEQAQRPGGETQRPDEEAEQPPPAEHPQPPQAAEGSAQPQQPGHVDDGPEPPPQNP